MRRTPNTIFVALALATVILSGCTTMKEETRISTNLKAREYNDIYSTYARRPTWLKMWTLSDGNTVLSVQMEHYGYNPTNYHSPENMQPRTVNFDQRFCSQYIELIDKYLDWESLARTRGDAITKKIGSASSWSHIGTSKLSFSLHSGNDNNHYLVIGLDTGLGTMDDLYFARRDAGELKNLLLRLQKGEMRHTSVDSVYK